MGEAPKEGDKAPAFALPSDTGTVSLKDFAGRTLVLYFYPKDDTSGCTREAIDFSELAGDFARAGAAVVGISADSPTSHAKFKAKHGLDVILASDEEKQTLAKYGVWIEKSMYGRKYMGIERSTFLIDKSGRISRVWRKVNVPNHVNEVLDAVRTH